MLNNIEMTINALETTGEKPDFSNVRKELSGILAKLDGLTVRGYDNLDKLLGCMMAIREFLGEEGDNGG